MFARHHQLAGDDEERASALTAALADPEVDVVWAARGGYGALRLLRRLDVRKARARVFAGYSDLTALHQLCWDAAVTAVHGAMPFDLRKTEGAANVDAAARLIGALLAAARPPPRAHTLAPVRPGMVAAPLAPANLAVLTRLIGTPFEPSWERVILCLEDVDEYLYAIDRMVWHLAASKLGPRIKAIVVGDFTGTLDNDIPWGETVEEIVARNFPGIPVASGLPFGHDAVNTPLVVGEAARLDVGRETATLTLSGAETA